MNPKNNEWVSVRSAASQLGLSVDRLRLAGMKKQLRLTMIAGRELTKWSWVKDWLIRCEVEFKKKPDFLDSITPPKLAGGSASIQISASTRDLLNDLKLDGETYDDVLLRIMGV